MRPRSAPALIAPLALVAACSDDTTLAPLPEPEAPSATFVTFNANLAGASYSKYEGERRGPIVDAIAGLEADVVCLQEVWRQSDKDSIAQSARERFPHALSVPHDLGTAVDDPQDQSGQVPGQPTEAVCAEPAVRDKLFAVMDCMAQNCSTVPGSDQGQATSTDCAVQKCTQAAASLLFGTDAEKKCYGCAAALLPTETLVGIREQCTTDPRAGIAFGGQNGLLILSRFPLEDTGAWVLPGTWNRRAVLRAKAVPATGTPFHVFCTHLTEIYNLPAYPYTGVYGEGQTGGKGWENEQLLQAHKLIAHVSSVAGAEGAAVILGGFAAGPQLVEYAIEPVGSAAWDLLSTRFDEALVPNHVAGCTFCTNGENPLAIRAPSAWVDHVLLQGIALDRVIASARVLTDAVVSPPDATDAGGPDAAGTRVPLSDHYGMRATVRLSP